jgi:hypothetical protein
MIQQQSDHTAASLEFTEREDFNGLPQGSLAP